MGKKKEGAIALRVQLDADKIKAFKFDRTWTGAEMVKHVEEKLHKDAPKPAAEANAKSQFMLFIPGGHLAPGMPVTDTKYWIDADKPLSDYISIEKYNHPLEYKKRFVPYKIELPGEGNQFRTVLCDITVPINKIVQQIAPKVPINNPAEYSFQIPASQAQKAVLPTINDQWLKTNVGLFQQGVDPSMSLKLRKKMFYDDGKYDLDNVEHLNELYTQYHQAIVSGKQLCHRDVLVKLAALSIQADYVTKMVEQTFQFFYSLRKHIPSYALSWKNVEKDIEHGYHKVRKITERMAKESYITLCRSLDTYGYSFFAAKRQDKKGAWYHIYVGIASDKIALMDAESMMIIKTLPVENVKEWSIRHEKFTIKAAGENIALRTNKAEKICNLLTGYVELATKQRQSRHTIIIGKEEDPEANSEDKKGRNRTMRVNGDGDVPNIEYDEEITPLTAEQLALGTTPLRAGREMLGQLKSVFDVLKMMETELKKGVVFDPLASADFLTKGVQALLGSATAISGFGKMCSASDVFLQKMDVVVKAISDVLNDLSGEGKLVTVDQQSSNTIFDILEEFTNSLLPLEEKKSDPEVMAMQAVESENKMKKLAEELNKTVIQITKPDQKAAALAAQQKINATLGKISAITAKLAHDMESCLTPTQAAETYEILKEVLPCIQEAQEIFLQAKYSEQTLAFKAEMEKELEATRAQLASALADKAMLEAVMTKLTQDVKEEIQGQVYLEELLRTMEKDKADLEAKLEQLKKDSDSIEDELYDIKEKKEKLEREIGSLLAQSEKAAGAEKAALENQIYALKLKFAELSNSETDLERKKSGLQAEIDGLTTRHEEVLDSVNRLSKELSESIEASKRKDQMINEEKIQRLQAEYEVQTITTEMNKLQSSLDQELAARAALERKIKELEKQGGSTTDLQSQKTQLDSSILEKQKKREELEKQKEAVEVKNRKAMEAIQLKRQSQTDQIKEELEVVRETSSIADRLASLARAAGTEVVSTSNKKVITIAELKQASTQKQTLLQERATTVDTTRETYKSKLDFWKQINKPK